MEIYILLGALLSMMIFLLGYAVVGVFRNSKRIDENHQWLDTMDRDVHQRIDDVYHEMDNERKIINSRFDMEYKELQSNLDNLEKDIISLMDKRLDKLENRLRSSFSDDDIDKLGYDLYKLKEQVDDFIRSYQNQ
jgi:peptidoglycan hydrolase CwlO-like protein